MLNPGRATVSLVCLITPTFVTRTTDVSTAVLHGILRLRRITSVCAVCPSTRPVRVDDGLGHLVIFLDQAVIVFSSPLDADLARYTKLSACWSLMSAMAHTALSVDRFAMLI